MFLKINFSAIIFILHFNSCLKWDDNSSRKLFLQLWDVTSLWITKNRTQHEISHFSVNQLVQQGQFSTKHLRFSWATEDVYVNVELDNSVGSKVSLNQRGENIEWQAELCGKVCYHLSLRQLYHWVYSLVFSVFRSRELREVSWSCCSRSRAAQCCPADWTHWLWCLLWV